MDVRMLGFGNPFLSTINNLLDIPDLDNTTTTTTTNSKSSPCASTCTNVRDARAMAATPADVKELPSSYSFVIDMPGVRSGEIKVQVEDDNVLMISGERKREEENEDEKDKAGKYLRMERRMGKFLRKFALPENADLDGVSAVCRDGVLTVTVQKKPPPEPKKPKTVEVAVA